MPISIHRTNNAKLRERKSAIVGHLRDRCATAEGAPITERDLRYLASMGRLSTDERALYDELRRIELLLGE